MSQQTTPKFWLQVKENYLLDNFAALVSYLRDYKVEPDKPLTDDLVSTLDCLDGLLSRLNDRINKLSLHNPLDVELLPQTKADPSTLFALFGAGILCARKFDRDATPFITGFVNLIVHSSKSLDGEIVKRLWDISTAAIQGCRLINTGFSWLDVAKLNDVNINLLMFKFAQNATFSPIAPDSTVYCENNGMVCLSGSDVIAGNLNFNTFTKSNTMNLVDLPGLITVGIEQDNRLKLRTFDEKAAAAKIFFNSLSGFKLSVKKNLKEYADGEELFVSVVSADNSRLIAKTIDPDYRPVTSAVFYGNRNDRLPSESDLIKMLEPGDIIKVKYHTEEYKRFNLTETLWRYYKDGCVKLAGAVDDAIHIGEYPNGTLWLTYSGYTISVDNNWLKGCPQSIKDKVDDAIFDKKPLRLKIYAKVVAPPNVYSNVEMDTPEPDEFTVNEARNNFLIDFINSCSEEAPHYSTLDYTNARCVDNGTMAPLANILCHIVDCNDMTASEKIDYVIAANILAKICNHELDASLLTFNRRYLTRIVDFSCNRPVRPLPLPEELADIACAREWSSIVESLTAYRPALIERIDDSASGNVAEKVASLVKASNDLAGAISFNEQNNIKFAIAQALNVEEEYTPLISEKQNFGQESEILEFKQSIVFPPVNRRRFIGAIADPAIQKWAILRAVNSFLNSKYGGDLLLGVNDKGFATGVENDYEELYKAKLIKATDLDNYTRYVADLLREAFAENGTTRTADDIYQKNIAIDAEKALNGKYILRISVRPNRTGEIRFADKDRPKTIAVAYTRRNCETLPVASDSPAI